MHEERLVAKKGEQFSILDRGVTIDGALVSTGKMMIKGGVRGDLSGEFVTIGPEGEVRAETKVKCMTIGGIFEGRLEASERVVVLSTGTCHGEVICRDLVVEAGGVLNAKVVRLPEIELEPRKGMLGSFRKKKLLS